MSALTEKIAAGHVFLMSLVKCSCGEPFEIGLREYERRQHLEHVVDVTEAAVRESIATELEGLPNVKVLGYPTIRVADAARIARGDS